MPYVQRDNDGNIVGKYAVKQPGLAEEFLEDDSAEMQQARHAMSIVDAVAIAKSARDQYLQSVPCPIAGGRPIQLDAAGQGNLAAASLQATVVKLSGGAIAWPQRMITRGWRLADNSWLPLSKPDDMIALGLWAAAEVERVRDLAWDEIDAARAAALPAAPADDSHK